MNAERKRIPITPGIESFRPAGALGSLDGADGPLLSRSAAALLEVAACQKGAALFFDRSGALSQALRRARALHLEPRILTPPSGGGLAARLAPSLGLQEGSASPQFQAVAAFAADFAEAHAAGLATARDSGLRARVIAAFDAASKHTHVGLRFDEVEEVLAAGPASIPNKAAAAALHRLARAEVGASAFGAPVGPGALLAPSPSGRRAAVLVDLQSLEPTAADEVEAIALSAIAAGANDVREALDGGPLVIIGAGSADEIHRFASHALAKASTTLPLLLLLVEGPGAPALPENFQAARVEGNALVFAAGLSLPLPQPPEGEPLSSEEVRRLTPEPLRVRLLGEEPDEEPGPAHVRLAPASERAKPSVDADPAAAANLAEVARKRARASGPGGAERKADYEAGDFEIK